MRTKLPVLLLLLLPSLYVAADIAPNPIRAKGIIPSGTVDIRMVWERVEVDLYRDSSVVEATFFMRNEGASQVVNIGFPEMHFYQGIYQPGVTPELPPGSFRVFQNGKEVHDIRLYRPEGNGSPSNNGGFDKLPGTRHAIPENYDERPWLLWDTGFEESDTMTIVVKYTLPYGVVKGRCRYFTYLVSTGSGWKGSIEHADIIVNLKDIPADHILHASPGQLKPEENRLVWSFRELNPTPANDIEIFYEAYSGQYAGSVANKPYPLYIVDDEIEPRVTTFDRGGNTRLRAMEPDDILSVKIVRESRETEAITGGSEPLIVVLSKNHAIKEFAEKVLSKHAMSQNMRPTPHREFTMRYNLQVGEKLYSGDEMLKVMSETDPASVRSVLLTDSDSNKTTIKLITES